MGVIFGTGYALPSGDEPLTHARIAHAGNWVSGTASVTIGGTAAGYFADAPDNSLTYERWSPSPRPAAWEMNVGSSATVDYCMIAAHDLGTAACDFMIQYWNGSAWVDLIDVDGGDLADDSTIFAIFEPVTATKFRVRIGSDGSAPVIGVIRFGQAMQMVQPIYGGHSPVNLSRSTEMRNTRSETGQFLGRTIQRQSIGGTFAWSHLPADWYRATFDPFVKAIRGEAFAIAWRPSSHDEAIYCWATGDVAPVNSGSKDFMEAGVAVVGLGYD